MIILALDPGRTTGACAIETLDSGFRVITALEIPWENRLPILEALLDGTYYSQVPQLPEAVVVETFRLRQGRALEQTGSDFPSSQVIGSIQAFLHLDKLPRPPGQGFLYPNENRAYGLDRLHFQEPVCMSRVEILPGDFSFVSGSEHRKDAYKHARFFYLSQIKKW